MSLELTWIRDKNTKYFISPFFLPVVKNLIFMFSKPAVKFIYYLVLKLLCFNWLSILIGHAFRLKSIWDNRIYLYYGIAIHWSSLVLPIQMRGTWAFSWTKPHMLTQGMLQIYHGMLHVASGSLKQKTIFQILQKEKALPNSYIWWKIALQVL